MSKQRQPGSKCGNCRHFQVRNAAEVDLARIAKDESECAPGEWVFEGKRNAGCHGGAVKGLCTKWRQRKAQSPAMMSTQWCPLWQGGGPVIRQAGGSPNRQVPSPRMEKVKASGILPLLMAAGAVALSAALGKVTVAEKVDNWLPGDRG